MSEPDEEFTGYLSVLEEGKSNFSEDEQVIIDAWIAKLSEPKESFEEKIIRNEYAKTLVKFMTTDGQLMPPFNEEPPDGDLTPLITAGESKPKKFPFPMVRLPCARTKGQPLTSGAIPKTKRIDKPVELEILKNEFEDFEEMAKVIARSKGQSFAEFVVAISRHTSDYGQQLRAAMKAETTSFREYVDNVLSQRIKDLTEVLDEEQNAELKKIKKDIDKWQVELSHCKKRIKEMIPDFDMVTYKKDKNYLKKIFAISPGLPEDDSYKKWKEETCHRLKWYSEMIYKLTKCNDQISQEITDIKSRVLDIEAREAIKQQNHFQYINCEFAEYQKFKVERDRLNKENAQLLSQVEEDD